MGHYTLWCTSSTGACQGAGYLEKLSARRPVIDAEMSVRGSRSLASADTTAALMLLLPEALALGLLVAL